MTRVRSIKWLLEKSGDRLGFHPMALYEHQHVLVANGYLHHVAGRGPGSGCPATTMNIAVLLASALAGETPKSAMACMKGLRRAKSDGGIDFLTGLMAALSPETLEKVDSVEVHQYPACGAITISGQRQSYWPKTRLKPAILRTALLTGDTLRAFLRPLGDAA